MNHYVRITLLSSLLLLISIDVKAQHQKNELEFAFGSANGLIKDEVFSPLNYESSGGTLSLNYSRNTNRDHLFLLFVDLQTLEMSTTVSDQFGSDLVKLNMEAAYLFRLNSMDFSHSSFFLGVDFHSNGNLINYEDTITLSSSGTYVSHRGLGLQLLQRNQFKKNRITLHAKLPVVGKVYRSPYNVFTKDMNDEQLITFLYSNGQFGSIHNYFNPSVSATISRPIIGRFFFTAGYEFDYLRSSVNQSITNFQGRLILAATFKF